MKTKLKLLVGSIILITLFNCEKEPLDTTENDDYNSVGNDFKTYNNGMLKSYSNDAVIKWNEALSTVLDNKIPQPTEARIYVMVMLAMHDALNNIVPKYETYGLDNLDVDASDVSKKNIEAIADAAVGQAAHDIVVRLYPPSKNSIDLLLETSLSQISDVDSKEKGISIGKAAASAIIIKRQSDFALGFTSFVGPVGPGLYQADYMPYAIAFPPVWPAHAVYGANLGAYTPFGIESGDQFRDEEPYDINSAAYTADYIEVKTVGCNGCQDRTAEQTEIASFWHESNASMMNRIARILVTQQNLNGWEAARVLGLVQMSVMDSYITSFDGYYYYNFWRPITAIRNGDSDGNPDTVGNPSWSALFTTPPTPEFPSTHGYASGATVAVLQLYFKSETSPFTLTSPYYLPGVERTMNTLEQIADECSVSRIYAGLHFRHSTEVSQYQGYELGQYVFENNLRQLKNK
ncbi:PAP2 superfamily protein [Flavobacteriaceae bacterium MAR_2010_188]|nr:PAP2 superfamily protein [Flavobacteriaceae bacterium MAR_2010_188]